MADYLIGIDIGTQGTKAALFDGQLNMIATAFEASKLISPQPGVVWQEADDLFFSVANTIRELLEKSAVPGSSIAAIGIDGQMAGIMGIDELGNASTYYDSWLDMRCSSYMKQMNNLMGDRIIELSGGIASYTHGPKILWWMHEQPAAYNHTAKFVLPHTYVIGRMTGLNAEETYFDYTHLHFSNFADTARKKWSPEIMDAFGVEHSKMPRIVSPFEVVGKTNKDFAKISGLSAGVPVVAGCGDTAAGTFGSGMFAPEMVLDIAGTASVLCSVVDKYVSDIQNKTLTMMRSPVDGLFLPLAYIGGGGLCIRWLKDLVGASYDELQAEARLIREGSDGLIFIPHFAGRVLPSNPVLKGSFVGLDFCHTRAHMYRSILESIAYEYSYYLSVLRSLYPGNHFSKILSMGGGAKSPLFNQIKSDILGMKLETLEIGETALIGSAVIAGCGTGVLSDYKKTITGIIKRSEEFSPDTGKFAAYQDAAKRYLDSIDILTLYYGGHEFD